MTDLPAREGLATVLASLESVTPGDRDANAAILADAVRWLRAHGAALLARVAELEAEVLRWQSINAANITLHRARAEAAEQVARKAVRLLDASACPNRCDGDCALCVETQTFLAHHGARTGESNE